MGGSVRRASGAACLPPNTSPNRCSGRPSGESKAPQPSPHPQQPELLSLSAVHRAHPSLTSPPSPQVTRLLLGLHFLNASLLGSLGSPCPQCPLPQVTRFLLLGLSASLLRALGSSCPQDTGLMLHSAPFSLLGLPGSPRP